MKINKLLALIFLFIQSFTYSQDPSKAPSLKQMLTQPEQKDQPAQAPDQNILKQASQVVQKSDEKVQSTHNTYQGIPITPQTLKKMAPRMSPELKQAVKLWVAANQQFLKTIVASPTPFDHETRKEKTKTINALIAAHAGIKSLSEFNYVLKLVDNDQFIVKINRWGSRMAYLVYATDQGSVLDKDFDVTKVDCSKLVGVPAYQHVSNVAHYLKLQGLIKQHNFKYLKTVPFYLVHVPGQPKELCDQNYITVQEFVPTFVDLRALKKNDIARYAKVVKELPEQLLNEIYLSIKHAALWDLFPNLGITDSGHYYILDVEEPFNHKPQFFFYQGDAGYQKYLEDVRDGFHRVANGLKEIDAQQFERWKKICEQDHEFIVECTKHNTLPDYLKA